MTFLASLLVFLAMLLRFLGAFFVMAILIYGIYQLFAESIPVGLMFIGASMVATLAINIVAGLLAVSGAALAERQGS